MKIYGGSAGAIHNAGAVSLIPCTLDSNAGGYNDSDLGAVNTIFADNTATTNAPDFYGCFRSEGHNLIGNDSGRYGLSIGLDNESGGHIQRAD